MKIESLFVENYCSLKRCEIDFDPQVNVIIGKNNVGKSSILTSIALLSELGCQAAEKSRPHPAVSVRGGYPSLVFGHDASLDISICSDVELEDGEAVGQELGDAGSRPMSSLGFEVTLEANNNVKAKVHYEVETGEHIELNFDGGGKIGTGAGNSKIEFEQQLLAQCWDKVRWLDASRVPEHESAAQGTDRLAPDGRNLVQLLNAIASSNARLFSEIEAGLGGSFPKSRPCVPRSALDHLRLMVRLRRGTSRIWNFRGLPWRLGRSS